MFWNQIFRGFTLVLSKFVVFSLEQTKKAEDKMENKSVTNSMENLLEFGGKDKYRGGPAAENNETPGRHHLHWINGKILGVCYTLTVLL